MIMKQSTVKTINVSLTHLVTWINLIIEGYVTKGFSANIITSFFNFVPVHYIW